MNTQRGVMTQEIVESLRTLGRAQDMLDTVALKLGLPSPTFHEVVEPEAGVTLKFEENSLFVPATIGDIASWVIKELVVGSGMSWAPSTRAQALTTHYVEKYKNWFLAPWFRVEGRTTHVLLVGNGGHREFVFNDNDPDIESQVKKAVIDVIISDNNDLSAIREILSGGDRKPLGTILDIPNKPDEPAYLEVAYKSVSGRVANPHDWASLLTQGNEEFAKREREKNMVPVVRPLTREWEAFVHVVEECNEDARCLRDKDRDFSAYFGDVRVCFLRGAAITR